MRVSIGMSSIGKQPKTTKELLLRGKVAMMGDSLEELPDSLTLEEDEVGLECVYDLLF